MEGASSVAASSLQAPGVRLDSYRSCSDATPQATDMVVLTRKNPVGSLPRTLSVLPSRRHLALLQVGSFGAQLRAVEGVDGPRLVELIALWLKPGQWDLAEAALQAMRQVMGVAPPSDATSKV